MSKAINYIASCGGGFDWEIKTNNFNIEKSKGYFVDTTSNPITATLPSNANIGDEFYLTDSVGSVSDSNYIIINNNGHNIMGVSDYLKMTERFMSLYMVYADAAKGWVIADGKGCDDDTEGGIISVDTTIYLAPSASSQSPDGVPVGSDETGDGTASKPFFSIKRAMEYLENYRIKIGAYVIIRGYPGKYYYNENHAIEIKHKDAKYIKVNFDMLETGNYHETTVTTDAVTVTNNSDHDLITFTVNDIGSGFYQIQAGDYIKIRPDNDILDDPVYAVWSGFYRVHSVDAPNNKITIVFKRYQSGGSYNTQHLYGLPTTIANGKIINVIKFSSHIYVSVDDLNYLKNGCYFYSEFGFGGFNMNMSNEKYYETGGVSGTQTYSAISIYDGIINDIIFHINGFSTGVYFDNLKCYFDGSDNRLLSMITSCVIGLSYDNSTVYIDGYSGNNCKYPFNTKLSSTNHANNINKVVVCNSYYHGISLRNGSYITASDTSTTYVLNVFYNATGIVCWSNIELLILGSNIMHNHVGISIESSKLGFFINYSDNNVFSKIHDNNTGILLSTSSMYLIYVDVYDNQYGIVASNGSSIHTSSSSTSLAYKYNIYNNSSDGINMSESYMITYNGHIYNNGNVGIKVDKSNINISDCDIITNTAYGVTFANSNGKITNCNINNNGIGVGLSTSSTIDIEYSAINNNTNYGLNMRLGSYVYSYHNDINNNSSHGFVSSNSMAYITDTNINDNGGYGINSSYSSKIQIYNHSGYGISGNTTYNIASIYNSNVDMFNHTAVTNTNPTKNTAPSYSGATAGNYILETLV